MTNAVPMSPLTTTELFRRVDRARHYTGMVVEVAAEAGGFTDDEIARLLELGRASNQLYSAIVARD